MRYQTEIGTQILGSSSERIQLILRRELVMKTTVNEEPTLKSVDESIKQATDPIRKRVEKFCALLASRINTLVTAKRLV